MDIKLLHASRLGYSLSLSRPDEGVDHHVLMASSPLGGDARPYFSPPFQEKNNTAKGAALFGRPAVRSIISS
jgi:hypothetical protein